MTLATGGSAWAATSTRSRVLPWACSRASSVVLIPSWAPSSSISRTREARIESLMRVVSRGAGRVWSNGRRLGLKGKSPSWAYSSSIRCRNMKSRCMQRPFPRRYRCQVNTVTRLNPRGPSGPGGEERSAPAFQRSEVSKPRAKFNERDGRLLAAALAHREALVALAVPVDHGERDLVELCASDPLPDRLRGLGDLHAEVAQALGEVTRSLEMSLPHRQHAHLHRREPERQVAAVVLEQDPDEALERPEQRAGDDGGRVLGVVRAHVRAAEPLGLLAVELDR